LAQACIPPLAPFFLPMAAFCRCFGGAKPARPAAPASREAGPSAPAVKAVPEDREVLEIEVGDPEIKPQPKPEDGSGSRILADASTTAPTTDRAGSVASDFDSNANVRTPDLAEPASVPKQASGNLGLISAAEMESVERFRKAAQDEEMWSYTGSKGGTKKYYAQKEGSAFHLVRGVAILKDVDMAQLVAAFADPTKFDQLMKMADTMYKAGRVVEVKDEAHTVCHASFTMPALLPSRDFVWNNLLARFPGDKEVVAMAVSVERDDIPPSEDTWGMVRGTLIESGYHIVDQGDGTIKLTYVVQADPGGWLPVFVVNLAAADQADNCTRIRKHAEKNFRKS